MCVSSAVGSLLAEGKSLVSRVGKEVSKCAEVPCQGYDHFNRINMGYVQHHCNQSKLDLACGGMIPGCDVV
jgi:hypothetical protein